MRRITLAVLLLLALLAPGAQAALTKSLPFSAQYGYLSGLDANNGLTVVSGALDVTNPAAKGSIGILETGGFTLSGLTRVCWNHNPSPCLDGQLGLNVVSGGSVGLCHPATLQEHFTADHALGLFVNLQTDDNLNSLPVGRSLVAPAVTGTLTLSGMQNIPTNNLAPSALTQVPCTSSGGLAALNALTSITVRSSGVDVATLSGKDAVFLFAGNPTLAPVSANFVVLPYNPGTAKFTPAKAEPAKEGLNLTRLQDLLAQLDKSHAGSQTQRENVTNGLKNVPAAVTRLLNGALLRFPAQANNSKVSPADITFVRFSTLTVTANGPSLEWRGRSLFAVDQGHVAHEHSLVKLFPFVALPWWSFVLWAVAIAAWIVAMVLKAPKQNPRWDPLRWIGWVAGPLAFLLVLWLVDLEAQRMFGTSFLKGSSGQTQLVFLGIDFALAATLVLMLQLPLRILLRSGFRLLRQGTLMGLAGPLASILAFFLGYSYFRAYLDLVLSQVVSKLG